MMARALAQQTDQLPLVDEAQAAVPPPVIGKSTVQAIRSGLFWSHVGAVRELVLRMAEDYGPTPQIFVAGGDAAKLATYLGPSVRVVPNLVFLGSLITYRSMRSSGN
jgi:type III pantothenate kinase